MQLSQTEAIGVLDDHHRGIRNIDANLDNRSSNEDLGLAFRERLHDLALLRGG